MRIHNGVHIHKIKYHHLHHHPRLLNGMPIGNYKYKKFQLNFIYTSHIQVAYFPSYFLTSLEIVPPLFINFHLHYLRTYNRNNNIIQMSLRGMKRASIPTRCSIVYGMPYKNKYKTFSYFSLQISIPFTISIHKKVYSFNYFTLQCFFYLFIFINIHIYICLFIDVYAHKYTHIYFCVIVL